MRKIGIITIFDPDNYGNRLQAYALSKKLQDWQCDVFEVQCYDNFVSKLKGAIKIKRPLRMGYGFFTSLLKREKNILKRCNRLHLFFDFIKNSRIELIRSNDSSVDYYVCGSDQIWNPYIGGTPYFFAAFAPKEKRIAYAASFGLSTLSEAAAQYYTPYLKDMAHIAVREHAGAALVKSLAQREAQVVLDPTLLLDRDDWHALARKPKFNTKDRYLLTYFLSWYSPETKEYIESVAKENGLQIINLLNFDKQEHWFKTGPAEFLWLIENATLVCTDSFHATVFSILMNTPFINFKRDLKGNDMHSRIDSLLNTFRLQDRVFGNLAEGDELKANFHHVPDLLKKARHDSLIYLENALRLDNHDLEKV